MGKERSLIDASVQAGGAAKDRTRRLIDLESELERRIPDVFDKVDAFILAHIPDDSSHGFRKPGYDERTRDTAPKTEEELLEALRNWDPSEVLERAFKDSILNVVVRPGAKKETKVRIKIGGIIDPIHEIRIEGLDEEYAIQKRGEYGNASAVQSTDRIVFGSRNGVPFSYQPAWSRRITSADLDKLESLLRELNRPDTTVEYVEE